jgi:hypothetical protein
MAVAHIIPGQRSKLSRLKALRPMPVLSGMRTDIAGKALKNGILLDVPEEEHALLRPHLEPVDLPQYRILYEPGEKIDFAMVALS